MLQRTLLFFTRFIGSVKLQSGELFGRQRINIGRIAEQPLVVESADGFGSESLNIHRLSGDKMLHFTLDLRRTSKLIGAIVHCLTLVAHQFCAAFGTTGDVRMWAGVGFPPINFYAGDFWDDFAALLHVDIITLTDIEFRDLVGVMERCPLYCGAS